MQCRSQRTADHSGDESGPQAPHHHDAGDGDGEKVRRHRYNRQPAEAGEHHRRHTGLSGEGDRKSLGNGTRTRQRCAEKRCKEHDPE